MYTIKKISGGKIQIISKNGSVVLTITEEYFFSDFYQLIEIRLKKYSQIKDEKNMDVEK